MRNCQRLASQFSVNRTVLLTMLRQMLSLFYDYFPTLVQNKIRFFYPQEVFKVSTVFPNYYELLPFSNTICQNCSSHPVISKIG